MLKEEQVSSHEISQLEVQAKQAWEQRRTRECVGLVKSLFQIDPENAEGRRIQAAIQKETQRDLSDAHALIEDSRSREDGVKYRKAAEIILLKIVYLDPDNEAAKALLAEAREIDEQQGAFVSTAAPITENPRPTEIPFTTGGIVEPKKEERRPSRILPILIAIVVIGGAIAFYLMQSRPALTSGTNTQPETFQPLPVREPSPLPTTTTLYSTISSPEPASAPLPAVASAEVRPADSVPTPPQTITGTTSRSERFESTRPVAFVEAGTLSVTSPVPAEVFMNGKAVGATPLSLQLIAGRHTLEYRRGNLKTVVTHEIKPNQTTNSVVSFDVTVEINARPWAQVYVDGTPRRPLGQTPLSNVTVPLGSVLIFENPNFATKSHRVGEGGGPIQMLFP